jgi:hypothetical protein
MLNRAFKTTPLSWGHDKMECPMFTHLPSPFHATGHAVDLPVTSGGFHSEAAASHPAGGVEAAVSLPAGVLDAAATAHYQSLIEGHGTSLPAVTHGPAARHVKIEKREPKHPKVHH